MRRRGIPTPESYEQAAEGSARQIRIQRGAQMQYAGALLELFARGRLNAQDITLARENELRELALWLINEERAALRPLAGQIQMLAEATAIARLPAR